MRFTSFASSDSTSGITVWKAPFANSWICDDASFLRSSDLGVMTMSGLRNGRNICRRSIWNICAAVLGANLHVVLGAELQKALETRRRGMLGPLPFVTVWQEHDQTADPSPLGLA